jgi:hypothetical protein
VNESQNPVFTDAELEASLQGLGAAELEQRLEFAPLLAGSLDGAQGTDVSVCCSCKIPPDPIFGSDAPTPVVTEDPTPGGDFWGTGPTSGGGF